MKFISFQIFVLTVVLLLITNANARPSLRVKRVSDQRLAELETLIALSKMTGKLVTVPLGFGKLDPQRIGRRRRSEGGLLERLFIFNHSQDENHYNDDLDQLFEAN